MLDIPSGSSSAVRSLVEQRASPLAFFVLSFGTTWLFQLPYLLAQRGLLPSTAEEFMPLVVLGYFGPFLIALALSWLEGRWAGVRALFRQLGIKASPGWYALALTLPCAVFLLMRAASAPFAKSDLGPWLYAPSSPQHFAAMLVIPLTEQIPWLGFAFPRLRARHGSLAAAAITGLAWSLFHLQKHWFVDPSYVRIGSIMVPYMAAAGVVFCWLTLRAGGSLLVAVLANAGAYLNNPVQALPASATPLLLHAIGLAAAAIGVTIFDRAIWRVAPSAPLTSPGSTAPSTIHESRR